MEDGSAAQRCGAFRDAWNSGKSPAISDYLPHRDAPQRGEVLLELVLLDAQMRVQAISNEAAGLQHDSHLVDELMEGYVSSFDELAVPDKRGELRRRLSSLVSDAVFETQFESVDESARSVADGLGTKDDSGEKDLDRYAAVAEHARGGMGVIWRVLDRKLGREVALKKLPAELAANASTRMRFVYEARVTAQLEHPGIVPIYDLTEIDAGEPSYTMKLLRGETLTVAIKRYHQLGLRDANRLSQRARLIEAFLSVCRTIAFAHKNNVLHRDIKPDNILLGEFGETAVLDWGLAKLSGPARDTGGLQAPADEPSSISGAVAGSDSGQGTRLGTLLGTPAYMSPEQARGELADQASDCYGLGAVLYQILTGRPPLEADTLEKLLWAVVHDKPIKPSAIVQDAPRPLEAICLKLLEKTPEARYDNPAEVVEDLQRYLADEAVSCAQESWRDWLFRWMRKHTTQVVVGVSLILLAATATTAWVLISKANQTSQFADVQRIQQARSAAQQGEAVAQEQLRNDDFSGAVNALENAIAQIQDVEELSLLQSELTDKRSRIQKLASYNAHYDKLYHYAFTKEIDLAYRTAKQCLVELGVDSSEVPWPDALPIEDLSPAQQTRLKEQVHGILLHLASIQASSGFAEFTRINAQASIFTVKSNPTVKSKIDQAGVYLDLADVYRATTAARYLRLIVQMGSGDISLVEWMTRWVALAPEESMSAVDCYYTSVIYGLSQGVLQHMQGVSDMAQLLGSESKMPDAKVETDRLLQKAIRLEPNFYPALYRRGMLLTQDGNFLAALESFNTCLRIAPDSAEGYTGRAMAVLVQSILTTDENWKVELRAQMESDIAIAQSLAPANGQVWQEIGTLRCYDGQAEVGLENLLHGLDLSSGRVLGETEFALGDPDAQIALIELTADLSGVENEVNIYKATLYADFRKYERAWELLRDIPAGHTNEDRAKAIKVVCACALAKQDDWESLQPGLTGQAVLQWADDALASSPEYYRSWYSKLIVLRKLGREAEALAVAERALATESDRKDWQRFELMWFKGELLEALDRQSEADAVFQQAREISEIYYEHFANESGLK